MVESLSKEVRASVVGNELASWGLCELGKDGAAGSQRHVPRCRCCRISATEPGVSESLEADIVGLFDHTCYTVRQSSSMAM